MNLPSSLFVTAVIFAVVWFAVAYQPGHEQAYEQGYINDATSMGESLAQPGFLPFLQEKVAVAPASTPASPDNMVATQPEPAAAAVTATAMASAGSQGSAPAATTPARSPISASSSAHSKPAVGSPLSGISLEGVSGNVPVAAVDSLWNRFSSRSDLHNRLNRMGVQSYALYRNFSEDFSRADVTLGYSSDQLDGTGAVAARTPVGNYAELLAPGRHSAGSLGKAWESIDYSRPVAAVLERHEMNASGSVIASSVYVLYR